jgi:hypothetical protein
MLAAMVVQAQPEPSPDTSAEAAGQTQAAEDDGDAKQAPAENKPDSSTSDDDFKPTEEISEDFPVSLPSDI